MHAQPVSAEIPYILKKINNIRVYQFYINFDASDFSDVKNEVENHCFFGIFGFWRENFDSRGIDSAP